VSAEPVSKFALMNQGWPMPAQHGTRSRYRKGCKCDWCREAEATYRARYRERLARSK